MLAGNRCYINECACEDLIVYVAEPTVETGMHDKKLIAAWTC